MKKLIILALVVVMSLSLVVACDKKPSPDSTVPDTTASDQTTPDDSKPDTTPVDTSSQTELKTDPIDAQPDVLNAKGHFDNLEFSINSQWVKTETQKNDAKKFITYTRKEAGKDDHTIRVIRFLNMGGIMSDPAKEAFIRNFFATEYNRTIEGSIKIESIPNASHYTYLYEKTESDANDYDKMITLIISNGGVFAIESSQSMSGMDEKTANTHAAVIASLIARGRE